MVKIALSAALLAVGMAAPLAHADVTAPSTHHHVRKAAATDKPPPADEPALPDEVRGWFEGAVGNMLSGTDVNDAKTPAEKAAPTTK